MTLRLWEGDEKNSAWNGESYDPGGTRQKNHDSNIDADQMLAVARRIATSIAGMNSGQKPEDMPDVIWALAEALKDGDGNGTAWVRKGIHQRVNRKGEQIDEIHFTMKVTGHATIDTYGAYHIYVVQGGLNWTNKSNDQLFRYNPSGISYAFNADDSINSIYVHYPAQFKKEAARPRGRSFCTINVGNTSPSE